MAQCDAYVVNPFGNSNGLYIPNLFVLQEGGSSPAPPTLLVIRVVLLHTLYGVSNPLIPQLYI